MDRKTPLRIALLGAESTGKTRLSLDLATQLRARGHRVAVVDESLRTWCEEAGRSPRPEEHLPIAQAHHRRIDEAAAGADIVIADTTALMVAIYGALLYEDDPLYRFARERQREFQLTLLTGLDLPWVPDGLQRQGPQAREPVDALVRELLRKADVEWRVVYGSGAERAANALEAVAAVAPWAWRPEPERPARWQGLCESCGEPDCERRLFTRLAERHG